MKNLIGLTLALALVLSVAPVMAAESFEGMESLSSAVAALPDADLATVEGGQVGVGDINIAVDINVAVINQIVALLQNIVDIGGGAGTNAQAGRVALEGAAIQQ